MPRLGGQLSVDAAGISIGEQTLEAFVAKSQNPGGG